VKPREQDVFITFSAVTKTNRDEIWDLIEDHIKRDVVEENV